MDKKKQIVPKAQSVSGGFVSQLAERYSENPFLRSILQKLDPACGLIDLLFTDLGTKRKSDRVDNFLTELNLRLMRVEGRFDLPTIQPSEEWIDFIIQVHDYIIRSRSREKHQYFAQLVTNQVINPRLWNEAEIACRMIGELTEHHIKMLDLALKAPVCDKPYEGRKVVTLFDYKKYNDRSNLENPPTNLRTDFDNINDNALEMILMELAAKGLLRDVGGGGHGGGRYMAYFEATDLAQWLLDWIKESV